MPFYYTSTVAPDTWWMTTATSTTGPIWHVPVTSTTTTNNNTIYVSGSIWHRVNHMLAPEPMIAAPAIVRRRRPTTEERIVALADEAERAAMSRRDHAMQTPEQRAISERAHNLLVSMLTPEQRADFEQGRAFNVVGKSGQLYRIRYGRLANIDVMVANDRVAHRLCVHPAEALPVEDVMLAQLMHLRDDDMALRRLANVHP